MVLLSSLKPSTHLESPEEPVTDATAAALQWEFPPVSGHASVRSWCIREKPATSFLPSHTSQEVFSDWLEGKKPSSHPQINVVRLLSASHAAVRKFVGIRIKKRLWHMSSQAWGYTGIHMDCLQNPQQWGDSHMQEHSRPHFLKCPCIALGQSSLQNLCCVFVLCLCLQIWEDSAL